MKGKKNHPDICPRVSEWVTESERNKKGRISAFLWVADLQSMLTSPDCYRSYSQSRGQVVRCPLFDAGGEMGGGDLWAPCHTVKKRCFHGNQNLCVCVMVCLLWQWKSPAPQHLVVGWYLLFTIENTMLSILNSFGTFKSQGKIAQLPSQQKAMYWGVVSSATVLAVHCEEHRSG